ncbi:MAG: type II toxin-antitoxin system Phd/YefM family antitoxin [Coriobacteriia bacterium]|nr:type II toxin-antitoxin system Phd/YefM family antitoxin [Coriobacteriia bacterium]
MTRVTAAEARKDFAGLINRAAFGKERVVITRHETDVAAIVPIEELRLLDAAREVLRIQPELAGNVAELEQTRERAEAFDLIATGLDRLVLAPESFDTVVDLVENPRQPTPALRDLLNDGDD